MKWALVLSGGGGKGIVHLGVLKGLYQMGLHPDMIVGTSMGALLGGIHCAGMSLEAMEKYITQEFDIRKHLNGWSYKLPQFSFFRFLQAGEAIGNLLTQPGLDKGDKIRKELDRLTGGKHFEDCTIPFRCNAADLLSGEQVVFSSGPLTPALYSSMAYPGVFAPYPWGKRLLSDGAVVDNCPVNIARKAGFRRILAVDVSPFRTVQEKDVSNTLSVALRAFSIASRYHYPQHSAYRSTLTLEARIQQSSFNFEEPEELIRQGWEMVKDNKTKILHRFAPITRWGASLGEPPATKSPPLSPEEKTAPPAEGENP